MVIFLVKLICSRSENIEHACHMRLNDRKRPLFVPRYAHIDSPTTVVCDLAVDVGTGGMKINSERFVESLF